MAAEHAIHINFGFSVGDSVRRGSQAAAYFVHDNTGNTRRRREPAGMRQAGPDVAFSGSPPPRNRSRREIGHLDGKLDGADLVNQMEDCHRRIARL